MNEKEKTIKQQRQEMLNSFPRFVQAIHRNDREEVERCIAQTPEVINKPFLMGNAWSVPIQYACYMELFYMADRLVEAGVDINTPHEQSPNHNTLLIHCAGSFNEKAVKWLLTKRGLNINAHNALGHTALNVVMDDNDFELANELVLAGANVNVKNSSSAHQGLLIFKVISYASKGQSPERMELLKNMLIAGARLEETNAKGFTALQWAYEAKNQEVIGLVQAAWDAKELRKTLSQIASKKEHQEEGEELIAHRQKRVL